MSGVRLTTACAYAVSEKHIKTGFLATVDLVTCQAIAAPATFTLIPQNFAVSADGTRLFMTGSNTLWMVVPASLSGGAQSVIPSEPATGGESRNLP